MQLRPPLNSGHLVRLFRVFLLGGLARVEFAVLLHGDISISVVCWLDKAYT